MTTLCSSPSSPRFFATKSELYKAPFLSFSILKRCHSRPPRNLNSNDSTYRDGNLFTICTSSSSEDQRLILTQTSTVSPPSYFPLQALSRFGERRCLRLANFSLARRAGNQLCSLLEVWFRLVFGFSVRIFVCL